LVLVVLNVEGAVPGAVLVVQVKTLDRPGGNRIAGIIVMTFAVELIAARLGHRADDATERATVFGIHSSTLDLDFLENLKVRVLPRTAVNQTVGPDPVHQELVFGPAGPIYLVAALQIPGVDVGSVGNQALEAAPFRKVRELFRSNIVGGQNAGGVDQGRSLRYRDGLLR